MLIFLRRFHKNEKIYIVFCASCHAYTTKMKVSDTVLKIHHSHYFEKP